jgi:hypothetical protein
VPNRLPHAATINCRIALNRFEMAIQVWLAFVDSETISGLKHLGRLAVQIG